ncbi:hypothetical protein SELMODRAFT_405776 [Selaginella moellendorffii]|uniref:Uncharacterized protein n=1 Tax=Selaginella moellendorffii TaxID=88036 RepID=D8QZN8_SELML|nr:hypothetical protein SELMODRAFT_405776 [Selaginella moellendorffii]
MTTDKQSLSMVVETPVAPSYIFRTGSFDWLRALNFSQPAEKHIDVGALLPSMQDSMVAEKTSTGKRTRSDNYEEQDHSPKRQEIASPGEAYCEIVVIPIVLQLVYYSENWCTQ